MTTNNAASLIALLDAVVPTVEDIAGEGRLAEKDRHALADLNRHIQAAQRLAAEPRIRHLLDTWRGFRLVQPRQRSEEEERLPVAPPGQRGRKVRSPLTGSGRAVIDYITANPGATCEEVAEEIGLSRSGTFAHIQTARQAGEITSYSMGRPVRYYPVTEESEVPV